MKDEIIKLRLQKKTYAEIGKKFGLSRQRIHQIISGYKSGGRTPNYKKIKKDNDKCFICRRKMIKLYIHHLDGDTKNDEKKNLFLVCHPCHKNLHARIDFLAGKYSFLQMI